MNRFGGQVYQFASWRCVQSDCALGIFYVGSERPHNNGDENVDRDSYKCMQRIRVGVGNCHFLGVALSGIVLPGVSISVPCMWEFGGSSANINLDDAIVMTSPLRSVVSVIGSPFTRMPLREFRSKIIQ